MHILYIKLNRLVNFITIFLCLCIVAACTKQVEKPKARPPALVVTAAASRQDVPVVVKAIGTIEASESVAVRAQISGELTKVAFREGQDVQKGALLFQVDGRTLQAALVRAEASLSRNKTILNNARKDFERYSQLVKDGIVTQEQAEGYRTKAEAAAADVVADQAAVDSARAQVSYCTITAPISGRLGALAVDRGNIVKANDTLLVTINKLTPVNVAFTITEKDLAAIRRQMIKGKVKVSVDTSATGGVNESGYISFIDNAIDPATGMIKLKAGFDNIRKNLWPGQFVNLIVAMSIVQQAVVVPSQAVQTGQKGQFVFVVGQDGAAEVRPVVVGPVYQGVSVIEKGVQPGEQVVIDGQMRVVPGSKVEVKVLGKGAEGKPGVKAESPVVTTPRTEKGDVKSSGADRK